MLLYKSLIGKSKKNPTYDCDDLISSGYRLRVAVFEDNLDLRLYIKEKEEDGYEIRLVELRAQKILHSVIDVWVKDPEINKFF